MWYRWCQLISDLVSNVARSILILPLLLTWSWSSHREEKKCACVFHSYFYNQIPNDHNHLLSSFNSPSASVVTNCYLPLNHMLNYLQTAAPRSLDNTMTTGTQRCCFICCEKSPDAVSAPLLKGKKCKYPCRDSVKYAQTKTKDAIKMSSSHLKEIWYDVLEVFVLFASMPN